MKNLGDRMKEYEEAYKIKLPRRLPIIVRIDGKGFHKVLKNADKPFDDNVKTIMDGIAITLIEEVSGAVFAYVQSDEINLLIINYPSLEFEPYFNNELQKIVSVTASIAASNFSLIGNALPIEFIPYGCFDSRAFILPREEVVNYFLWRQRDCTRNSVQMVARNLYKHEECENKNNAELQEMIFKKGINWDNLNIWKKRGRAVYKESYQKDGVTRTRIKVDNKIPVFSKNWKFIGKYVDI